MAPPTLTKPLGSCRDMLSRELKPLNFSVFVATLGVGLYVYFIPLYAQRFGGSFLDLGFIGTAYSVTYAVGPIFAGYIADRVSRAWLYSLGVTFVAFSAIALSAARSVTDIVILRSAAGLAFAFFWPTSEALVAELSTEENRLKEMGVYSVFWSSGFLIGPMVGGLILQTYGYPWLFTASFVLIAFAFVISVSWVVPRHPRKASHPAKMDLSDTLSIMKGLVTWYIVIVCYGIIANVIIAIFPGYANVIGITPVLIGTLFSAYYMARITMYSLAGRLNHFRENKLLLTISAIFGRGTLVLAMFPGFDGFILGMILLGCCSGIMFPLMISLIARHFPREKLGIAAGSYETTFGLGYAVGPILAGSVALLANIRWAFVLVSFAGAVMFIFVIIGKSK